MIDRDQKRRPHILKVDAEGHDYQVLYLTSTLLSSLVFSSLVLSSCPCLLPWIAFTTPLLPVM